jgi:hypothetical protein
VCVVSYQPLRIYAPSTVGGRVAPPLVPDLLSLITAIHLLQETLGSSSFLLYISIIVTLYTSQISGTGLSALHDSERD